MIHIRAATEADLPVIVALLADDPLGTTREDPNSGPAYHDGFRRMRAQGGTILLATEGPLVLGCLQLDVIHGVSMRGRPRAQVEGVRVARARRGEGIGAQLMAAAIARAREAGCALVQLTSNRSRTDAIRFYERLGFAHSHAGMKLVLS